MGKKDMKLFWGSGSGPCMRAMIALEEKGFGDIDKTLISFSDKGHKSPEVLAINPRGQVPAFKDGNVTVNESKAICLYLENRYPKEGNPLLPADGGEAGKVLQTAEEVAENLQSKIVMKCIYYHMMTPAEKRDKEVVENAIKGAKDELQIWEDRVTKSGGDFVCGKQFTLADVILFPYIASVVRFGSTLSNYPGLKSYYERLRTRDSITKSWPPHWLEGELEEGKRWLKAI